MQRSGRVNTVPLTFIIAQHRPSTALDQGQGSSKTGLPLTATRWVYNRQRQSPRQKWDASPHCITCLCVGLIGGGEFLVSLNNKNYDKGTAMMADAYGWILGHKRRGA